MNQIIMWIMAVGAVLGGVDRIAGNRFGLGKRFEEGFTLLGPTALSMSGIICLTPLLSRFLRFALVPIWNFLGLDAGLLAGILAIDMGGYQLAGELSASQEMVRYAGLVIAATLGCTITFTIPVGMGMLKSGDRLFFSRGMLIGTGTLPVTMIVGGLLSGLCKYRDRTSVAPGAPLLLSADVRHLAFSGTDRARVHGICRCDPASDDDRPHRGRVLLYDRLFAAPGPCAAGGRDGGRLVYRHCTARQPSDGGAFTAGAQKAALFYWKKNRHERQQCRRPSDGHCQPCSGDHNDGKNGRARKDCKRSFPRLRRIDHRRTYGIYVRHRS